MASYEALDGIPIIGFDGQGSITLAAKVVGSVKTLVGVSLHVATWEAGQGQRFDYMSPADFSDWRRSFIRVAAID